MTYRDIKSLMDLRKPAAKNKMVRTLLKGQALPHFGHHLRMRLDSDLPDHALLELVLINVGWSTFPKLRFESRSIM
jgi:hypothetical protein